MFQCEGGIDSYVNSLSEDSQSCWPGSSAVGARLSLKNSCGVHREGTICGLVLKAEGGGQQCQGGDHAMGYLLRVLSTGAGLAAMGHCTLQTCVPRPHASPHGSTSTASQGSSLCLWGTGAAQSAGAVIQSWLMVWPQ